MEKLISTGQEGFCRAACFLFRLGDISPLIRRQSSRLTKSLLLACAVALGVAGCLDEATHTKITRCADGLEVAVFYDKNCSFPPPAKVEFRKGGKVVTLSWEEEYLLEEVVSPDQKWIFLQEANNGRFKFCPENRVMQCLEDDHKFVHIIEASGSGDLAGFIFDGWEAPHTALITFAAGGETEDWKVDLEKKVITRRNPKGEPMFKPVFLEVTK